MSCKTLYDINSWPTGIKWLVCGHGRHTCVMLDKIFDFLCQINIKGFGSGQIVFTSEPIQTCTHTSVNKSAEVVDWPPHETLHNESRNIEVRSIRIPKWNIMVMHIVMLKNSNTNIQVHGEDWDGGWEIWREKNPKHVRTQHWNSFDWEAVLKLSRRYASWQHLTCWTSPLYHTSGGVLMESQ